MSNTRGLPSNKATPEERAVGRISEKGTERARKKRDRDDR